MDVRLRNAAAAQDDIVAVWQLRAAGWSRWMVDHRAAREGWRQIHDGVYALCQAPLTQRQRWIAAVLTAPHTYLFADSACACHGFADHRGGDEIVVRPGSGGRRQHPGILVARSTELGNHTMRREGIPLVTPPMALVSVAARWVSWELERAFREAIRLKTTTANDISRALNGQRGTRVLRSLCDRYATIPYHRCRSDAESRGLEVLHDAGVPPPEVNVRVAGREGDFVWRNRRLIIEIDGPQWHLFADQDAIKQAIWEGAGYTVRRIPSDDVYFRPERLLALARRTSRLRVHRPHIWTFASAR